MGVPHLNLLPPQVELGRFNDLVESGQTISASLSPLDNSVSVFIQTVNAAASGGSSAPHEEPVYFASLDTVPTSERRLFIVDTLVIFSMFQRMLKSTKDKESSWIQSAAALTIMRKLGIDYVNFIKECWIHSSQPISRPEGPLQFSSDHYKSLYSCFSLFVILYLPDPGYEDAPVGDELMEWLNIHFIEPSTEEGDHLSSLDSPWEDENFWPYLIRATLRGLTRASSFFLNTLLQHPSEELQDLIGTLTPLVGEQPRLQSFTAERDFAYASRRWRDRVKALRVEMDRVPEDLRFDDHSNWWDPLSDLVGILEGRGEVIQRVCEELGSDWKEVCAAWGVFVDPRLRRQDLPDVMVEVLENMPPDPTNPEDMILSSLLSNQPEQALRHALKHDLWLAAHLADIMEPLGLLDPELNPESEMSKRDEYIMSYAEYLHSDPSLWRITVAYMYSCGVVGQACGDEVLLRVPLRLDVTEENPQTRSVSKTVKEINEVCRDFERELVRRAVCSIAATASLRQKDYGLAVSYCLSAEHWPALGRVVDTILDEYIRNGAAVFMRQASKISRSLQDLCARSNAGGIFIHRLNFAIRYSEMQRLRCEDDLSAAASEIVTLLQEEIAPRSWWAILLCDSVELLQHGPALLFTANEASELLRRLEEISIRTAQGSGDDYLSILMKTTKSGGEKEAMERLKSVRLALARYFARCTVMDSEKLIAIQST